MSIQLLRSAIAPRTVFRSIHEQRAERWLGADLYRKAQEAGHYWPVPVLGFDEPVFAYKGDLVGYTRIGQFASYADLCTERAAKVLKRAARLSGSQLNTGFPTLSSLISAMTEGGKGQFLMFTKAGATGVVGCANSLWNVGAWPVAAGAGGTTGTGAIRTRTSTGALTQQNPGGTDTLHLTTITLQGSVAGQMLLLYDHLWDMTHTMTVDPRSCDAANVPNRYQTAALAPGNFFSGLVTTVLPAATPTITLDYVDQDGNNVTGSALSTIRSAAAVNTCPFTAPNWFYPLASTDQGLRSLQNSANAINLSAAMASGVVTWFIGHPLAFIPMPAANTPVIIDGINSAFNLFRIQTDACLAFMEIAKSATTATNWWGQITAVSG
jgi:hypothetical protein